MVQLGLQLCICVKSRANAFDCVQSGAIGNACIPLCAFQNHLLIQKSFTHLQNCDSHAQMNVVTGKNVEEPKRTLVDLKNCRARKTTFIDTPTAVAGSWKHVCNVNSICNVNS